MTIESSRVLRRVAIMCVSGILTILGATEVTLAQAVTQPFYLERTVYTEDSSGKLAPSRNEVIARKADGTTVEMQSVGPLSSAQYLRKVSFTDGRVITLIDATGTKTTWPNMNEHQLAQFKEGLLPSRGDCGAGTLYTFLRADVIDGIEVAVVQRVIPGMYRVTRWLAPKLGCRDVQYQSEAIKPDGTFALSAQGKLAVLRLGEPEQHLFEVDAGLVEVKPSEAQRRLRKKMDFKLSAQEEEEAEKEGQLQDMVYQRKNVTEPTRK